MKYNVCVTLRPQLSTVLEVEADGRLLAEDKAINIILEDPKYGVIDFNGDRCEVFGDDITIDSVEVMGCAHVIDPTSTHPVIGGDGSVRIAMKCKKCGVSDSVGVDDVFGVKEEE